MTRRTSQPLTAWFVAWDLLFTAAAWLASYAVRFHSGLFSTDPEIQPPLAWYLRSLPLILILALVAYRAAGMYEVHRLRRFREELVAVGKGVGLMALAVMAMIGRRRPEPSFWRISMVASYPSITGMWQSINTAV